MKIRSALVLFGSVLIFLGAYLFPLGYDSVFFIVQEDFAGGDYWTAVIYLYILCFALMGTGAIIATIAKPHSKSKSKSKNRRKKR